MEVLLCDRAERTKRQACRRLALPEESAIVQNRNLQLYEEMFGCCRTVEQASEPAAKIRGVRANLTYKIAHRPKRGGKESTKEMEEETRKRRGLRLCYVPKCALSKIPVWWRRKCDSWRLFEIKRPTGCGLASPLGVCRPVGSNRRLVGFSSPDNCKALRVKRV